MGGGSLDLELPGGWKQPPTCQQRGPADLKPEPHFLSETVPTGQRAAPGDTRALWGCRQGMEISARYLLVQDNRAGHTSSRAAGCRGEFINKPCDRSGQPADTWGADKGWDTPVSTCACQAWGHAPCQLSAPGGPQAWGSAPTPPLIHVWPLICELPQMPTWGTHIPCHPSHRSSAGLSLHCPQHPPRQKAAPSGSHYTL